MNQEIIARIFGNLQGLEKTFDRLQAMVPSASAVSEEVSASLPEWQSVLQHMRRVAITMQLQFAKGHYAEVVRSLKIFYGLNQMVRPEIIAAIAALTTPHDAGRGSTVVISRESIYH